MSLLKACNPDAYKRFKLKHLIESLALEGIHIEDRSSPDVLQRYRDMLVDLLDAEDAEIDSVVLFINYMTDVDMSVSAITPFGKTQVSGCDELSVSWVDCAVLGCEVSDIVSFCAQYDSVLSFHELSTLDDLA